VVDLPVRGRTNKPTETWAGLDEDGGGLITRTPIKRERDRSRDDTIEERPRSRAKKPAENKNLPLLIGAGVGAGVLLLVGVVLTIVLLSSSNTPSKPPVVESTKDKNKDKGHDPDKDGGAKGVVAKDGGVKDGGARDGGARDGGLKDGGKIKPPNDDPIPVKLGNVERRGGHVRFKAHTGHIHALAVSRNGKLAATAGQDGTIVVLDLENEKKKHRFEKLPGLASSLAFTADGTRLIAAAGEKFVEFDLETGERAIRPARSGISLAPGGRYGAGFSVSNDKPTTTIWDVETAKPRGRIPGPTPGQVFFAFDSTGSNCIAVDANGLYFRMDLEAAREVLPGRGKSLPKNTQTSAVCWGPANGGLLLAYNDGIVRRVRWGDPRPEQINGKHGGAVRALALSPDETKVLSTDDNKDVRLFALTARPAVSTFRWHTGLPRHARFCSDKKAVTADDDGRVILWDLDKPMQTTTPTVPVPVAGPVAGEVRHLTHRDGGEVRGVMFSKDGKKALSAYEAWVVVHDLETGKVEKELKTVQATLLGLAASKDWKHVLTTAADRSIRRWNIEKDKEETPLAEKHQSFQSVVISPDGKYALTGGGGILYGKDGKAVMKPDGKTPVLGDFDLRLWDLEKGGVALFSGTKTPISSVAFSGNGKYMAASSFDPPFRVWELKEKKEKRLVPGAGPPPMTRLAPADGDNILVGTMKGEVLLWDCAKMRVDKRFSGKHEIEILALAMSPDGKTVLSTSGRVTQVDGKLVILDPTVRIHDVATGKEKGRITLPQIPRSVAISPDSKYTLIGETGIRYIDLTKVNAGEDAPKKVDPKPDGNAFNGHTGPVNTIAVSPDGQYLVSGGEDTSVRLWEAETGKHVRTFSVGRFSKMPGNVLSVRFTPDGSKVLSAGEGGIGFAWEVESGKMLGPYLTSYGGKATSIDISASGQDMGVASADGAIGLRIYTDKGWNASHGAARVVPGTKALCVAAVGKATIFAVGYSDGAIRLLNMRGTIPELGLTFPNRHPKSRVLALAYDPKTDRVFSAGSDKRIVALSLKKGVKVARLQFTGHVGPVTCLALSPDGKRLVSGSKDKTIRVWDTTSGKLIHRFDDEDEVRGVAFGSDGKTVFSAGKRIRVWRKEPAGGEGKDKP
jgi:WD40 repeat protein